MSVHPAIIGKRSERAVPCIRVIQRAPINFRRPYSGTALLARRRNSDIKVYWASCREARRAAAADETSLRQLGTFDRVVSRPNVLSCPGARDFFASGESLRITAERKRERERGGTEDEKDKEREERNVARTNCGSSEMRDMRARSLAWEWTGRGSKNGNECRDGLYKWASYSIRDALGSALTSE